MRLQKRNFFKITKPFNLFSNMTQPYFMGVLGGNILLPSNSEMTLPLLPGQSSDFQYLSPTLQVIDSGVYYVSYKITALESGVVTGSPYLRTARVYANGNLVLAANDDIVGVLANAGMMRGISGSGILRLAAGDKIQFRAYQNSPQPLVCVANGPSGSPQTSIEIFWISD